MIVSSYWHASWLHSQHRPVCTGAARLHRRPCGGGPRIWCSPRRGARLHSWQQASYVRTFSAMSPTASPAQSGACQSTLA